MRTPLLPQRPRGLASTTLLLFAGLAGFVAWASLFDIDQAVRAQGQVIPEAALERARAEAEQRAPQFSPALRAYPDFVAVQQALYKQGLRGLREELAMLDATLQTTREQLASSRFKLDERQRMRSRPGSTPTLTPSWPVWRCARA